MAGHDRFIRREMKVAIRARKLFEFLLEPKLKHWLDLEGLEPLPNDHIDPKLRELITDLAFKVPLRDEEVCICLVFEHKSEGALQNREAVDLPFQLREQEITVMRWFRDNHPERKYPIVIPIGFYHGSKPYKGPLTVAENMVGPVTLRPAHWKAQTMILIDLARYSDEELLDKGRLGLFLLVLKHIYDRDLLEFIRGVLPMMQALDTVEDRDFLISLFTYFTQSLAEDEHDELGKIAVKSFSEEVGGAYMTIADRWIREGEERANKRAEAKDRQAALDLFNNGVDLEIISKSIKIPLSELTELIRGKAS